MALSTLTGGKASERKVVHTIETTSTKLSWWRTGVYLKLISCAGIPARAGGVAVVRGAVSR